MFRVVSSSFVEPPVVNVAEEAVDVPEADTDDDSCEPIEAVDPTPL